MHLDLYIAELLQNHDCVIVPDFGGFVANYASARINAANHRFDPPYRKISFNKYLIHNDGLLATYVAQKEALEYNAALKNVKAYTLYLKEALQDKKQISIDRVGVLYQLSNGTYRFEQIKNPEFFRNGFGLESFFAKELTQVDSNSALQETDSKVVAIGTPVDDARTTDSKKRSGAWVAVAAAVSLPIISYSIWMWMGTPLFNHKLDFHYSDLNPFSKNVATVYEERNHMMSNTFIEAPTEVELLENTAFVAVYHDNEADKTLVARTIPPAKGATKERLRFHIVGGCFGEMENARALVAKYKSFGTNASLIDQKGQLFRVSVQSFATRKQANEALETYRQEIPGAWVLYK